MAIMWGGEPWTRDPRTAAANKQRSIVKLTLLTRISYNGGEMAFSPTEWDSVAYELLEELEREGRVARVTQDETGIRYRITGIP